MATNTIDAGLLAKMFLAGAKNLEVKKEWINELNVFPVPDGDTGTNMTLTIMSAVKEVNSLTEVNMYNLSKAISSGSLRGARGNSGVILSQLLRGFTKKIRDYQELNAEILAEAMEKAVETAYKAVMKPKEGTILTVAKGAAEKAAEKAEVKTPARRGRKPAAEKVTEKVEDVTVKKNVVLQFDFGEYVSEEIVESCIKAYQAENRAKVKSIDVYVKPADMKAYYVVNGKSAGSGDL